MTMTDDEAALIKRRHSASLWAMPGVHGMSLQRDERGEPKLVLLVDPSRNVSAFPTQVDSLKVTVEQTEPFRALPAAAAKA